MGRFTRINNSHLVLCCNPSYFFFFFLRQTFRALNEPLVSRITNYERDSNMLVSYRPLLLIDLIISCFQRFVKERKQMLLVLKVACSMSQLICIIQNNCAAYLKPCNLRESGHSVTHIRIVCVLEPFHFIACQSTKNRLRFLDGRFTFLNSLRLSGLCLSLLRALLLPTSFNTRKSVPFTIIDIFEWGARVWGSTKLQSLSLAVIRSQARSPKFITIAGSMS